MRLAASKAWWGAEPSEVPRGAEPTGYAWLVRRYALNVMPHHRWSFTANVGRRQSHTDQHIRWEVFPNSYKPADLGGQLTFALKYDGISIEILRAFFRQISPADRQSLQGWIASSPTGAYARRCWFLYEWLTEDRLELSELYQGNYVLLLDPDEYFTGPPERSSRQRIENNLLGPRAFCPLVRRTPSLQNWMNQDFSDQIQGLIGRYDADAIQRSVSYLYTKETRSSFEIEREAPNTDRTRRFIAQLRLAPTWPVVTKTLLVQLQQEIVGKESWDTDWRDHQNYVGDGSAVYFIPPAHSDLPALMGGWLDMVRRLDSGAVDAVVAAAIASFSFVFLHPFQDGNGRIHRLLIHYVLSKLGLTPRDMILPISATILAQQRTYDACLERFSVPLMERIRYELDSCGTIEVEDSTEQFFFSMDLTPMAEALYGWVERCIQEDFKKELGFIQIFREARLGLRDIVDLSDRDTNHLLARCLENDGRLSKTRRKKDFDKLTDAQVEAVEQMLQRLLSAAREREQAQAQAHTAGG